MNWQMKINIKKLEANVVSSIAKYSMDWIWYKRKLNHSSILTFHTTVEFHQQKTFGENYRINDIEVYFRIAKYSIEYMYIRLYVASYTG